MAIPITGHTELIGLIATPIRHSGSPAMHNAAFSKLGLDYVYLVFEVGTEDLEDTVRGLRAMKVRGFNVSMPNKTFVGRYLDHISPAARLCGAVNTVVNDNGVLTGYITDGIGYMQSLQNEGITIIGKKITLLGAGGAATAIAIQAALDGVREISIFNRADEFWSRGEKTVQDILKNTHCRARLFPLEDLDALRSEISDSVLLANATSVGMKPREGQCLIPDASYLRPDLIVSDVIYSPAKTALLELAESVGCQIINGHGMMLFQGAAAFKLWTGQDMPIDYVKKQIGLQ